MKIIMAMMISWLMMISSVNAAQRKPIATVDTDRLTKDTQVSPAEAGDGHMALVWWVPVEFWQAVFSKDSSTGETNKKQMLDTLSGVSLLAVVQADINSFGAFNFYPKEIVDSHMRVTYTGVDGKAQTLTPLTEISPDLEIVVGVFKPILGSAMGNLGKNFHFYVLNDKATTSKGFPTRVIDPYQAGELTVQIAKRSGTSLTARVEMPLNELFVPRLCPGDKPAHVTWKYCPWTGTKLSD